MYNIFHNMTKAKRDKTMLTDAYKNTSTSSLSQRELEAGALFKMASNMNQIRENWEEKKDELYPVLEKNRKLWSIFAADLANPDNPLPKDLKEKIGSLALFIFKHSLGIVANPKPESLDVLININMQLAKSLSVPVSPSETNEDKPATTNPTPIKNTFA